MSNPIEQLRTLARNMSRQREFDPGCSLICRYADEIERNYVELPKDADGVPIRVGDEMDFLGHATVDATDGHNVFFFADNWVDGVYCEDAALLRHHHKPTVEDVLFEFARLWCDEELPDMEHLQPEYSQAIAEFAAKLREVMGND